MKAISAGLFPSFLKQDDINAEKDYASFSIADTTEITTAVYYSA